MTICHDLIVFYNMYMLFVYTFQYLIIETLTMLIYCCQYTCVNILTHEKNTRKKFRENNCVK